jgi:DNA-binding NtrC family response regulator
LVTHSGDHILIIEDERLIRLSLRSRLEREGYCVSEAETCAEGLKALQESPPDLVLLDYRLPDGDGISLLREFSAEMPNTVTILMTAYATVESVVEAMKLGAYTYVNKPFEIEELVAHVKNGLKTTALRREVERLRRKEADDREGPSMIAESPAMKAILDDIKKINRVSSSTVLLRGENGTGKDVLAHFIHRTSSRYGKPFQNITCTALPDTLLESELFGHERGAFTDARARKLGLLELANGGTVFLDEIGDLSPALQAKLLRFLEERRCRRLGGTEDVHVDVRIIAATNRDLESAIQSGSFRQDLFYRLAVIPIQVPPLRERREDILPLSLLFVDRFNREFNKQITGISSGARRTLEAHDWPGNVRELRNTLERAMILGSGDSIEIHDLSREIRGALPTDHVAEGTRAAAFALPEAGLVFEDLERDLVLQSLQRTGNNQSAAARLLGMTRDQIRYRIEKFGLG